MLQLVAFHSELVAFSLNLVALTPKPVALPPDLIALSHLFPSCTLKKAVRRVELLCVFYSPTDALMNSRNSGCGRLGRDTNSGWN